MVQYALKVLITALVVVTVSEMAKRNSVFAALVASLPLTSLLAFVWLYLDTRDAGKVASLSVDIFWLVIPSLALFLALPLFLRLGWGFWLSLLAACGLTAVGYASMLTLAKRVGIPL